jgi:hypothetical protein
MLDKLNLTGVIGIKAEPTSDGRVLIAFVLPKEIALMTPALFLVVQDAVKDQPEVVKFIEGAMPKFVTQVTNAITGKHTDENGEPTDEPPTVVK